MHLPTILCYSLNASVARVWSVAICSHYLEETLSCACWWLCNSADRATPTGEIGELHRIAVTCSKSSKSSKSWPQFGQGHTVILMDIWDFKFQDCSHLARMILQPKSTLLRVLACTCYNYAFPVSSVVAWERSLQPSIMPVPIRWLLTSISGRQCIWQCLWASLPGFAKWVFYFHSHISNYVFSMGWIMWNLWASLWKLLAITILGFLWEWLFVWSFDWLENQVWDRTSSYNQKQPWSQRSADLEK